MRRTTARSVLLISLFAAFSLPQAEGTTLLKLGLDDLVERSGRVFRGTVVSVTAGTVEAGGAALPTVTYVFRVEEALKGDFLTKDDVTVAEVTMFGTLRDSKMVASGALRFSAIPQLPRLDVGSDYLMFITRESEAGLATAVGLGQGAFTLYVDNRQTYAVNAFNNANLDLRGPVLYSELATQIRAMLGK